MTWELIVGLFVGAAVSGILPLVNAELLVVATIAASGSAAAPVIAVVSALGQMTTKSLLYMLARWAPGTMPERMQGALERTSGALAERGGASGALMLLSASTGIPPFYGVSLAAGALRVSFVAFLWTGVVGRTARFGALAWAGTRLVGAGLALALVVALAEAPVEAQSVGSDPTHPPRGIGAAVVVAAVVAPTVDPSAHAPAWAADGVPVPVWKLAEAATAATDGDVAKALLDEAEVEARAALAAEPESVGRRFGLAVVLGMRTDREGGATTVRIASELYETLEDVLAKDPEHARAQHMLGRLHAGVQRMNRITRFIATKLLGGEILGRSSWEQAERYLSFAEREAPEISHHHLQLALLYRDTGRPDLAHREIAHVLDLEATSPMEAEVRAEALALEAGLR